MDCAALLFLDRTALLLVLGGALLFIDSGAFIFFDGGTFLLIDRVALLLTFGLQEALAGIRSASFQSAIFSRRSKGMRYSQCLDGQQAKHQKLEPSHFER